MPQTHISNLERDGEVRDFKAHGHAVVGSAGGAALVVGTFEPGWRFSIDVGPLVGTTSCQTRHLGYVMSGRMNIQMEDGTELQVGPGDLFDLPAGHDAWVIGDEPVVMVDTSPEATRYAKGGAPGPMVEDRYIELVRRGYEAFNTADADTLIKLMAHDVVHHVPGSNPLAGEYKGIEAVLGYYAALGKATGGTFRADLIDCHADGRGHVAAVHQITATRKGVTRVSRGTVFFSFLGEKMTDLLELHGDLAGDDAFLS
ncbi:MAG TPA: nuclear transport factor 2 family protein [Mycobacteriales bacterium]|jgi:ketosteroid isomerase-like protein|nr:nuclear transport factor 2 family protein [Mycobacteriales bacterium]